VQQAPAASDPTLAWGHAALPDATMVAAPGWLGTAPGGDPSDATRAAQPSTPENKQGPGRHGQRDDARPDTTRVFPTPER
jgi:hypothetical protein